MRRFERTLVTTVLSIAIALGPAVASAQTTAPADRGVSADNAAVAINTKDGTDLFRLAFSIDRIMNGSTNPQNAAVAFSSCIDCETTAIAIQFVILMSPTSTFVPENFAIAVNELCTSCETIALAYQFVMQTDGPVKLSPEGKKKIKELLRQIQALEDQDLDPAALEAQVDALADQIAQVLSEELEARNNERIKDAESESGDQQPDDQLPEPNMTTSPEDNTNFGESPAPSSEPTSDPSASPAASEPAPDPSPAATP
jgi:putative peptide zinc metalloprotease protein